MSGKLKPLMDMLNPTSGEEGGGIGCPAEAPVGIISPANKKSDVNIILRVAFIVVLLFI